MIPVMRSMDERPAIVATRKMSVYSDGDMVRDVHGGAAIVTLVDAVDQLTKGVGSRD